MDPCPRPLSPPCTLYAHISFPKTPRPPSRTLWSTTLLLRLRHHSR
ncbi:unnamed protein product [Rhizoctonia solani]|uniref:Uncharacterized protein n=1 Tax=Rhizoctonia solani TaxID=456999 RepID=A0A8H3CYL4_9AGAM|nr:unnamed protein product [Rhizoctonia solani]